MTKDRMSARTAVQSLGRQWAGVALIIVVLLGGTAGSLAAMAAVERSQQGFAGKLMNQNAASITQAVEDEASRYSETLSDLAASVGAQSTLTSADFKALTSQLNSERLPGASGAAFVVAATDGERAGVQAYWRTRGVPDLQLTPIGNRPEHMYVVFSQPLDRTIPNLGRDLSQVTEPLEALQLARSTGRVAASRTYVLLKDRKLAVADQQLSFTLTTPVYGSPGTPDAGLFRGWVLLGMRGADFIDEVLGKHAGDAMQIALYDESGPSSIAVTETANRARSDDSKLERTRAVTIGQREWRLRIQPTDLLLSDTDRRLPKQAGWGGALLTVLIVILVDGRRRALGKVDRTTAELRLDIEQRKAVERRLRQSEHDLRQVALHDPLTGLANRTLFYERLDHAMLTHNRTAGSLGVLFIDLDGFKAINDGLGHSAGDAVLAQTADRLRQCARDSDTVARFGGDEFAILTELLAAPEDIEIIAARVVRAMQAPFDIDGRPAVISCSVGVALHHDGIQHADDLLHRADDAMYAAKAAGKDGYRLAATSPA